ncbi:MarC family protein [Aquabacterium sp.]|uniref:MarC family protein n=1 Tax=Aquabacterium sp. TaxID=1872578 RepID=UPI0025C4C1DB|nr:MarC family protein [Aquabacterium sp.]
MEHDFLSAFIVLLIVTDPLGNVPVVISLLKDVPKERRLWVITRECAIATLMLLLFMLGGESLLKAMRLSNVALEIAGGVILFLIALGMAFPSMGVSFASSETEGEPLLVPLAIPLIAGPSALATVVLLASRQPERAWSWTAAIVLAMGVGWAVLASAQVLSRRLGRSGLVALERFMGLLLSAMAVEMLISGLKQAFGSLPH